MAIVRCSWLAWAEEEHQKAHMHGAREAGWRAGGCWAAGLLSIHQQVDLCIDRS